MADNLRSSTKVGENPTFATTVSKQEGILGDKAVGGMDNDKDHVENVIGGLKASSLLGIILGFLIGFPLGFWTYKTIFAYWKAQC